MGGIYILDDAGQLTPLGEQAYDSEALLQDLLADHPELLAGAQGRGGQATKWLLIGKEGPVPSDEGGAGRWAVDHLFLDQQGVPTLVEVKRSSDTRIRREVVGQMLDYAANAVAYWPVEDLRIQFERTCQERGRSADEELAELLGPDADPEEFWQAVKTNLQAGRVRLVFVADQIPNELRRIVEFLNDQMDRSDVLAVEVKQYVGQRLKALVPTVLGQTAGAQQRKAAAGPSRQWDEASFMDLLKSRSPTEEVSAATRLLAWARERNLRIWWGKGKYDGSFYPIFDRNGLPHWTFSVWTYRKVQLELGSLAKRPPFAEEEARLRLIDRLNEIPGVDISPEQASRYPTMPLSTLVPSEALQKFLAIMDDVVEGYGHGGQPR